MGNALAEIRARLAAAEKNKTFTSDNSFFPFWNGKNDSTSAVRFLPDGDPTNTFFWVEKLQIKLPFNGIKGGESKPITVSVPCVEMFPKSEYPTGCPILSQVRAWYKDPSMKETANKYWKKPSYLMQGFVRENAVADDKVPENPIRKFSLNKQLFNLVKSGLMDVDMENIPSDYEKGSDFRIVKTLKGQYADYGTSSYSRKETALTQAELDAIEKYKLSNLAELLGKKPTDIDLKVIVEMFEASVDGEEYDPERWGKYYRPSGMKFDKTDETTSDTSSTVVSEQNTAHTVTSRQEVAPSQTATSPEVAVSRPTAADILAKIKARGQAK